MKMVSFGQMIINYARPAALAFAASAQADSQLSQAACARHQIAAGGIFEQALLQFQQLAFREQSLPRPGRSLGFDENHDARIYMVAAYRARTHFSPSDAMAQYEHLPIYKKAYDLTVYIETVVRSFSRYHKYTLGTELRNLSREVLRLIRAANNSEGRAPLRQQNRERLEDVKIFLESHLPKISIETRIEFRLYDFFRKVGQWYQLYLCHFLKTSGENSAGLQTSQDSSRMTFNCSDVDLTCAKLAGIRGAVINILTILNNQPGVLICL